MKNGIPGILLVNNGYNRSLCACGAKEIIVHSNFEFACILVKLLQVFSGLILLYYFGRIVERYMIGFDRLAEPPVGVN
jgi:hypothetical protein